MKSNYEASSYESKASNRKRLYTMEVSYLMTGSDVMTSSRSDTSNRMVNASHNLAEPLDIPYTAAGGDGTRA